MKLSDFLAVLERFFLDVIGTVIPGTVFLIFGWFILGKPFVSLIPLENVYEWVFMSFAGYIAGHAIISIGERIVLPFIEFMQKTKYIGRFFRGLTISQSDLDSQVRSSASFIEFAERSKKFYPRFESDQRLNEWRNLAMSIEQESNQLVYRFMFISLLNLGIATAAWLLVLIWLLFSGLDYIGILWFGTPRTINLGILLLTFIVSLPFLERRRHFFSMAMRIPIFNGYCET